jgi:hypothetical protein
MDQGSRLKTGAIESFNSIHQGRAEFFALPIWAWRPIASSKGF